MIIRTRIIIICENAESLRVPYASAQRYVQQLEKAGSLHEITGQARNRIYRANDILAAIEAPLTTEVTL